MALTDPNPNINTAAVTADFNIIIWQRAYLSVDMRDLSSEWPAGRVGRQAVLGDWQERERAVIPGTYGQIRAGQSGTRFVRWEIT
jgi:hypothetical protein